MKFRSMIALSLTVLVFSLCAACSSPTNQAPTVVYKDLHGFSNVNELMLWLAMDSTDQQEYIPVTHDCEDFAIDLQKAGQVDGYLINLQFDLIEAHVLDSVVIDNYVYFIEPQTDEIWYVGSLDQKV